MLDVFEEQQDELAGVGLAELVWEQMVLILEPLKFLSKLELSFYLNPTIFEDFAGIVAKK